MNILSRKRIATYVLRVLAKVGSTRSLIDTLRQDVVIDGELDHLDNLIELGIGVEVVTRQVDKVRLVSTGQIMCGSGHRMIGVLVVRDLLTVRTATQQQRLVLTAPSTAPALLPALRVVFRRRHVQ